MRRFRALAWLPLLSAAFIAAAPPTTAADAVAVGPPDVFAKLSALQADLEMLRHEMGRPVPQEHRARIENAAPREVYFQVETLFKKANTLAFEHSREVVDPLPPPSGPITPADVMRAVESASERIGRVKSHVGIEAASAVAAPDATRTPTDVFYAALAASRQLNLLLDRPFPPSEVYEELTLAIGYAARLRARFPGHRIPEMPPFEAGKLPADVLRKLLECFAAIQRIAARSGLSMLQLEVDTGSESIPRELYAKATGPIGSGAVGFHIQIASEPPDLAAWLAARPAAPQSG